MREPYGKAVAPRTGPEPWRYVRKDVLQALVGVRAGWVLSREIIISSGRRGKKLGTVTYFCDTKQLTVPPFFGFVPALEPLRVLFPAAVRDRRYGSCGRNDTAAPRRGLVPLRHQDWNSAGGAGRVLPMGAWFKNANSEFGGHLI